MAIHICRDLIVGSTGSYSNLYAISCFLEGVMGFTRVGSAGRSEWTSGLLPQARFTGSLSRFPGMQMYCSGGVGVVEVPISQLDIVPDDDVGFVYGINGVGVGKPEYLDVTKAATLIATRPWTYLNVWAVTGSTIPPGTPYVTQSMGVYYISYGPFGSLTSGAINMNVPLEQLCTEPVAIFVDDAGTKPGWVPGSGVPQQPYDDFNSIPSAGVWSEFVIAIRSDTYPSINSGLYRIIDAGRSIGSSVATGSVTGTFKLQFDTRTLDTTSFPIAETNFRFTVFPPVESIYNDLDTPFDTDPDNDGDVDVAGYDNNPPISAHFSGDDPGGATGPDFNTYTYTPPSHGPPFRNYYGDTAPSPNDLDDVTGDLNKASLFYLWNPASEQSYPDSVNNPRTRVAALTDRPANLWGMPNDGRYHTTGSSYMLRVIYQSPHSSKWQVRLAMESAYDTTDAAAGGACTGVSLSIAPGFSGSGGDFAVRGHHLHGPQWFNTASSSYRGTVVGLNPVVNGGDRTAAAGTAGNQAATGSHYQVPPAVALNFSGDIRWRFFAWGDDATGTTVVCIRNLKNANEEYVAFGLPEDEPVPLPAHGIQRLFAVGNTFPGQGIDWRCGTYQNDGISGVAYSLDLRRGPVSCTTAPYVYLTGVGGSNDSNHQRYDAAAGDNPFTNSSELLPVDLIAGTRMSLNAHGDVDVLPLEPRRLGRYPIARLGRANQSTWTTIGSNKDWFHVTNGFYLPWGGMTPLP